MKSLGLAFVLLLFVSRASAFSIGTQNLMHYPTQLKERVATVAAAIQKGDVPDIIGFQEAAYWGSLSLYGSFVELSGYHGFYQDTNNYLVVNDGIALQTHLPVAGMQSFKLPGTVPLSNQYIIAGRIETEIGAVGVIAAHFSPSGKGQKTQAAFVLEKIQTLFAGLPTIIVGDLNDTPKSDTLQEFRDAGYTDALNWQTDTFVPHVNPFNHDKGKALRIDYILYHPDQLRVQSASLMFQANPISDHYGLRAEFSKP